MLGNMFKTYAETKGIKIIAFFLIFARHLNLVSEISRLWPPYGLVRLLAQIATHSQTWDFFHKHFCEKLRFTCLISSTVFSNVSKSHSLGHNRSREWCRSCFLSVGHASIGILQQPERFHFTFFIRTKWGQCSLQL